MKISTRVYCTFGLLANVLFGGLFASPVFAAQDFTLDNPLLDARWRHEAVLLPDGEVLIAGGVYANDFDTDSFGNTNSCELFNPATGASRPANSMADSHASGAATRLSNGLVLVAGGQANDSADLATAELYNPITGQWTNTGSLSEARESIGATLLADGKFMVVGGFDNTFGIESTLVDIYNPATGTWTNAQPMPFGADSQSVTLLPDGTVLVAGGSDQGNLLTNVILYNPTSNSWTYAPPMSEARGSHAATLLPNGKVLVVGGDSSAELYNPTNKTWTNAASMNDSRTYPSATLLTNGQVLVVGGDPWETNAELYDPTSNTWTYTTPLNFGRVFHTATLARNNQVVVAGGDAGTIGYYNGPPMNQVETYNQSASFDLFGSALNKLNLAWTNTGDNNWFVETTNTYTGPYAAQSGSITNSQSSTLSVNVTGPGKVTFFWSSIANDTNQGFDYQFLIDGSQYGDITGTLDWRQAGPFDLSDGQHTLSWTVGANGDTDPTQAGFLDQVDYFALIPTNAATNPIGWWKADDNAFDSAGTNHGSLQGRVTFAPGMTGDAFNFDGNGDFVELPGVSDGLPEGTISLWTYLRAWDWQSAGNGIFLWAGTPIIPQAGSFDGINLGNHHSFTSNGELLFGIFGSQWNWAHSGVVPQTNTWYHVAGTWGSGGLKIYVNGQLKGTNAYTGSAPGGILYNLVGRSAWPGSEINGLVDDVRLYNRALSDSEIAALSQSGVPPTLAIAHLGTNVILTWPLGATGFTLQSVSNLATTNWQTVGTSVFSNASNFFTTNGLSNAARFYRLKQ